MKLKAILYGIVIMYTTPTHSVHTLEKLTTCLLHRIKVSQQTLGNFTRQTHRVSWAMAATVLHTIQKAHRIIRSGAQKSATYTMPTYQRLRRLTRATAIISLTTWYSLTSLFGFTINCLDSQRRTLLYRAIRQNKTKTALSLIYAGADPNAPDLSCLDFPLHCAVGQENIEVVNALLRAGADPNIKVSHITPPLHTAILTRNIEMVHTLINAHANLECTQP